ncbi:putative diguanylate cyclase YcdT [bacterium BMS3Abin07]|nr:putative diguanylate cyclase YcdT [bacterium BMS3Abin07]HDL21141.1 diguanylate cyclase [Nitrospirota bacterium]HDO21665.1 diguanylate cyclase [Nitrospirota bacterium]HDZ88928.1 diguanylate cyclase [Nitrospirota bacterium]
MADRRKYQKKKGFIDRRTHPDRRRDKQSHKQQWRYPSWSEQRLQYITRYVLLVTGLIYFNGMFEYSSSWMSITQLNLFLFGYVLFVTISFIFAHIKHHSPLRFRIAMWVDIFAVSIGVLNDPFVVPLCSLVYIIIVLGNGMRYSMSLFVEALAGSFASAMIVLTMRYAGSVYSITPGVVFLYVFATMILVYSYILMQRIDVAHQNLQESSRIDHLTGLLNRSALMESVKSCFSCLETGNGNDRLVVMFADMDKFKQVNDTLGHAVGDQVLVEIANIIRYSVRGDDIAARYGGDEFVLVIRDIGMGQADMISKRIQESVRTWGRENGIDVSLSIGIGEAPTHGNSFDVVLESVDRALYYSKSTHGPGGVCHADTAQVQP